MNNGGGVSGGGGGAPTGCYKCGRPGHWSRDCPFNPNSSADDNNNNTGLAPNSNHNSYTRSRPPLPTQKPKQKAQRRTRPKLTPDLLLSDAGIGYILRYFPRALKCRGRGYEFKDLKHLLVLYAEWHSRLLPYFNFRQFIQKVEQVGSTKRVKVCLRDLRERVSEGVDLTKLHETQVQQSSIDEDAPGGLDMPNDLQNEDANNFQDDMPHGILEKVTEETCQLVHDLDLPADACRFKEAPIQIPDSNAGNSNQNQMSEEQRARMEANRLRALERAAARQKA